MTQYQQLREYYINLLWAHTRPELQALAKDAGLSALGRKVEIIDRLISANC